MTNAPHPLATRSDFLLRFSREKDGEYFKQLRLSKVPTYKKAIGIAIATKRGISAQESCDVVGLVRLGVNVPSFASKGDYVWIVRFAAFGDTTQEAWVSSSTGNVKCIFPLKSPIGGKSPE